MSRDIHLHIRINRKTLVAALAIAIVCATAYGVMSEKLTVGTSYPSPVGIYKKMITTAQTILARDAGNVGIGTTNPVAKLDVSGRMAMRGTASGAPVLDLVGGPGGNCGSGDWSCLSMGLMANKDANPEIQATKKAGSKWGALLINRKGGNVGIGTLSPNDSKGTSGYLDVKDVYIRDSMRWASEVDVPNIWFSETIQGNECQTDSINLGSTALNKFCAIATNYTYRHGCNKGGMHCRVYISDGNWHLEAMGIDYAPACGGLCGASYVKCRALCLR
ncbi:hypothetical protein ACFL2T_03975 [Elusimicrobiota bacterium]